MNIPIIDFEPFLTADRDRQQQVAQAVFQACHDVGFWYLKHPGIPPSLIQQAFGCAEAFFSRPLNDKQRLAWSNESSNRGYVGYERERLDETQPGDLKEAFNVGRASSPDLDVNEPPIPANQWPADDVPFRETVTAFFKACAETADHVFRAFAIALSMPPDYLVQRHQTHDFTLRLLHYPALSTTPEPGQLRAGAHTDYGTLTLLFQQGGGGLEVLSQSGAWISAPVIPDTILVNTGDLMQRWSNDVFRSTRHRVRLPEGDAAQRDRYSIAYFCEPDAHTEIACLPTCCGHTRPPKYAPINAREYLLSRLRATY